MTAPPEHPPPSPAPAPPAPPGQPRTRRPGAPLPPADRAAQHRAIAALLVAFLGVAGLLGINYVSRGIFVVLYTMLAAIVALWLAVTAMISARRAGTRRPRGSVAAAVIAGIGLVMGTLLLISFVVLGPQLAAYSRCLDSASSPGAQQACQTQFDHAVTHKLNTLRNNGQ